MTKHFPMTFGSSNVGQRIRIVMKGYESDDNTAWEATVLGAPQGSAGRRTLSVSPVQGNQPQDIREDKHDIYSVSR